MKRQRRLSLALCFALLLALLCGCSRSGKMAAEAPLMTDTESYYKVDGSAGSDYAYEKLPEEPSPSKDGIKVSDSVVLDADKIVYTGSVTMETLDYAASYDALQTMVKDCGGYFEKSEMVNGNYCRGYFTIRIPAAQFNEFYEGTAKQFHVTQRNCNATDVSSSYYDLESRLATQRTKLERLNKLLEQAYNMGDIITIESAISETELQIEYYTGALKGYDARIQYATLDVILYEVQKLSYTEENQGPVNFGTRLAAAFRNGWRSFVNGLDDLAIFLAESWVGLLILAGVAVLVVGFVRRRMRRIRRKKVLPDPRSADEEKQ